MAPTPSVIHAARFTRIAWSPKSGARSGPLLRASAKAVKRKVTPWMIVATMVKGAPSTSPPSALTIAATMPIAMIARRALLLRQPVRNSPARRRRQFAAAGPGDRPTDPALGKGQIFAIQSSPVFWSKSCAAMLMRTTRR